MEKENINVGWVNEFRDWNYHSKEQSNLNEEKRICI